MPDNNEQATNTTGREVIAEILNIGDSWLPGISEYDVTLEDIDGEGTTRTEDGIMHREIIREKVYHANVTHIVTLSEMIDICNAVKEDATITVTALCPGKGSEPYSEITAYVSKLEQKLVLYKDPSGEIESWWNVSYTLVEV